MSELVLKGLDGRNPLGFLAALGTLNALDDGKVEGATAQLAWRSFTPVLIGRSNKEDVIARLLEDVARMKREPALSLEYEKSEKDDASAKGAAKSGKGKAAKVARDLKPPPGKYLAFLESLPNVRGSLDLAAAFGRECTLDDNGNVKPTALHFTTGKQEFLTMVLELRDNVGAEDFEEALFGPWKYAKKLPILQWDNTMMRDYALRASNPSKDKKLGVPGADWLAFRALPMFRVAPRGRRPQTSGYFGGWKDGVFRWPLWRAPLEGAVIRAMVASTEIAEADLRELEKRGVSIVFESEVRRAQNGGRGSFGPARVAVGPARREGRRRGEMAEDE